MTPFLRLRGGSQQSSVAGAAKDGKSQPDTRPLVLHVVHRFSVGGLENGIVNLINHLPATRYRHAVLSLTEITDFRCRLTRKDADLFALHKPPGHGFWLYPQVCRYLRMLRPAIVHTRNLAALEMSVPAWWVGVPVRIHGEHGRDVDDLKGQLRRYQRMRRAYRPFVSHYVALSSELTRYLVDVVKVPAPRVTQLCNGVDTECFSPAVQGAQPIEGCPFSPQEHWIVGTVGRMQAVKDQLTLARGFVHALRRCPSLRARLRLVMVGDGPLRNEALALLMSEGLADLAWLPGERADVAAVMRGLHCFVLPSLAEGISNTILEAMASGLPVIATEVGGNAELVRRGITGEIVPAGEPVVLGDSLLRLAQDPACAAHMGRTGRLVTEQHFSLKTMLAGYERLYDTQLALAGAAPGRA